MQYLKNIGKNARKAFEDLKSVNHNKIKKTLESYNKSILKNKKRIINSKKNFINIYGILNNNKKNYKKIQREMKKNKLPKNKEFIEKLSKIIGEYD